MCKRKEWSMQHSGFALETAITFNDGKRLRGMAASLLVQRCRNACGTGGWEGSICVTKSENDQQRNARDIDVAPDTNLLLDQSRSPRTTLGPKKADYGHGMDCYLLAAAVAAVRYG